MCYSNNNPLAPYRSLGRAVSPIGSVLFFGYRLPMLRQTKRPLAPYRSLGRAVSPIGSVLLIGYRLPMLRQTV